MKIIIFGATGTVGRITVKEALEEGHKVTAFARNPEKLGFTHDNLRLIKGNAYSQEDVQKAVGGHDAVIVTLGSGMSRSSKIRSIGTLNIIRAMQHHGLKRLICQSTLGAHESWDNLNFFWKYIMFGFLLRPVFKDHELQEQLVQASGLDWTIVRPSAFTDGRATKAFKEDIATTDRNLALKITRSDIANFLTRQLSDPSYHLKAVGISN